MSNGATVRVGLIGAGSICRERHLPGLRAIEGVELIAVCNRSPQSAQRVVEEFSCGQVETDWRRLVTREDVDAIVIGTWPYTHAPMSIAALQAGKHVFCQARMASTLEEAQAMWAAAESRPDLVNMICPPPHRMPWEAYIRHVVTTGELGELRAVRLWCCDGSNLGPLTWREQVELSGIQVMQVGIWAETIHAWLGEYDRLVATTATPIATKPGPDGQPYAIRIPQVVTVSGLLQGGWPITEYHCGVSSEPCNSLWIEGSRGALRIDALSGIFRHDGNAFVPADVPESFLRDWQVETDFIEAVRRARQGAAPDERPVSPDFAEGLKYMRKMAALHRSAATEQFVAPATLGP